MTDDIADFGPVSWMGDLFENATAESMYRWVILAWVVAVVAFVALDRLGSGLLGRSRPLVQPPPVRARAWRWGRRTPPPQYSLLPPGAIAPEATPARPAIESIPIVERRALPPAPTDEDQPSTIPPRPWLSDAEYWPTLADDVAPVFGYENNPRLAQGQAPERFNPVTGRVESLDRNPLDGALVWPGTESARLVVGPDSDDLDADTAHRTPEVADPPDSSELPDEAEEPESAAEADARLEAEARAE